MEDIPVIIFTLLFFLVLILIGLHRSNKKFADKISVLEQTVELKAESLSSMKEIYAQSQVVLQQSEQQQKEIESKKEVILGLKNNKSSLEEAIRKQEEQTQQLQYIHNQVMEEATQNIIKIEKDLILKDDASNELNKAHIMSMKKSEEYSVSLLHNVEEKELLLKDMKKEQKTMQEKNLEEQQELNKEIKNKENDIIKLSNSHKQEEQKSKEKILESEKKEESLKTKIELWELTYAKNMEQAKEVEDSLKHRLEKLNVMYEETLQENKLKQENITETKRKISELEEKNTNVKEQNLALENTIKDKNEAMIQREEIQEKSINEVTSILHKAEENLANQERTSSYMKETYQKVEKQTQNTISILENNVEEKQKHIKKLKDEHVNHLQVVEKKNQGKMDSLENVLDKKSQTILELNEMQEEIAKETVLQISILEECVKEKDDRLKVLEKDKKHVQRSTNNKYVQMENELLKLSKIEQRNTFENKAQKEKIINLEESKKTQELITLNLQTQYDKNTEENKKSIQKIEKLLVQKDEHIGKLQSSNQETKELMAKVQDAQDKKIVQKEDEILRLTGVEKTTQIDMKKLEDKLKDKEKSMAMYHKKESVETIMSQTDIKMYIQQGKSKEDVAKKFGIPLKRVELIMKFDKIKKENKSIS